MDATTPSPLSSAPATAVTAGPPGGPPSSTAVPFPAPTAAAAPPTLTLVWPGAAQWATAVLLILALVLLLIHVYGFSRLGTRPAELQRGSGFAYRVDLNQARRAELLQLPGVGPSLAERIEKYRTEHGGFRSVEDLLKVGGIGPTTLERLRPWVCVQSDEAEEAEQPAVPLKEMPAREVRAPQRKPAAGKKEAGLKGSLIDLNRASLTDLQRLPGIGPKLSQRIVDERSKKAFAAVDELRRVPGIGAKTLERLRPYLTVRAQPVGVAKND